jgi:hypothetical protein
MKISTHLLFTALALAMLFASACNYAKPVMYVHVTNHSGHPLENLELKYPSGSFGLPELRNEQIHRRMVPMGTPCKFRIAFEDQTGKKYSQDYDLGARCPTELHFDIGAAMKITETEVRR